MRIERPMWGVVAGLVVAVGLAAARINDGGHGGLLFPCLMAILIILLFAIIWLWVCFRNCEENDPRCGWKCVRVYIYIVNFAIIIAAFICIWES